MYLVCQRHDFGITPLRFGEPMKMQNKQTNKPRKPTNQKNTIKQTNQHTPYYSTPPWVFGHLWTHFDFQKSFLIYFFVLSDHLVNFTSHFKNRICKDLASCTSGQKSSITILKYPVKTGTHFKEYFAFSLTEF